jgi:hypothetical protein
MLHIILASFSPSFTITGIPSNSLSWDQPATGFIAFVVNPLDYPTEYISSVYSITESVGSVSDLSTFTAGNYSATPSGGVNWNRSFTTNTNAVIRPISTTRVGGSVYAEIKFNYIENSLPEAPYSVSTANLSISWAQPSLFITLPPLTGNTFLQTYTSDTYTINVTGMQSASNYLHAVTATNGSISNATGNGIYTFATPIHKDIVGSIGTVTTTTTFTRPETVTGNLYTVELTVSGTPSVNFTYPSVSLFTENLSVLPTIGDIVSGTSFKATQLGNQVSSFAGNVTISTGGSQAFWFGFRSSLGSATKFETGTDSIFKGAYKGTLVTASLSLQPTPLPSGYNAVPYTFYGITLQGGRTTYVSIS